MESVGFQFREGSSPRVWGILILRWLGAGLVRFIPTGVGNTRVLPGCTVALSVHPHGCGEYLSLDHPCLFRPGSSPRVWGILGSRNDKCTAFRFIPTGVGNTVLPSRIPIRMEVHPHGCGEYQEFRQFFSPCCGSSPRVWGILEFGPFTITLTRFIPTGVGNTSVPSL